jgi:type I restriction enzyme, S subunit
VTKAAPVEAAVATPAHWDQAALRDVVAGEKKTLDPRDFPDESFEYYSIPAYQSATAPVLEKGSEIRSQKLLIEPSTVLFGKLNPRVPKVWRVPDTASKQRRIASTEFIPLRPRADVMDCGFLYFLCWSGHVMPRARGLVSGSTPSRQRVDPTAFMDLVVPVPPLDEQRAIARILLAIRTAETRTRRVARSTRELKRSLATHLLTYGPGPAAEANPRALASTEVGDVPRHWGVIELNEVINRAQYGLSQRGELSGRVPILRMNNLDEGKVTFADLQFVDLDSTTREKFRVHRGDLLFNRTNSYELVGKTARFVSDRECVLASYLIRVEVDEDRIDGEFLNHYLNWEGAQRRLRMLATRGVSQSNISATKLKSFTIPLPPLAEQKQIAGILSALDRKGSAEDARASALARVFAAQLEGLMNGEPPLEGAHG